MSEELSIATDTPAAGPTNEPVIAAPVDTPSTEGEAPKSEEQARPEKTPEQREIDRLRRGIDRRTRQLAEERARNSQRDLTSQKNEVNYQQSADDSEPLSLTRAQLHELVKTEAAQLAPTLRTEAAEAERRASVVQSLAKTWGQEKFDEVASDLDDAFGGLTDRSGKPKPAIEAVFEADEPARVIEWLSNPDNIDEAERISKLSAAQAGKQITKLEARLSAEAAKDKPKASKAPAPLEAVRGQGAVSGMPDPSDTKKWIAWRNEQERKGL